MKNINYIPLEFALLNDDRIVKLIETYGLKGLGAYMVLSIKLSNHSDLRCGKSTLQGVARAYGLGPKTIEAMLNDFGLFERETVDNRELFSSPYVNRVMGKVRKNRSGNARCKRGCFRR
ncbi:DUF4373 domain-containing protein [Bacteroides sp. OttesenSCG-928-F21]|nr:DUF4373 domain-containing protein [Bacteroides sp. OttesenSCG-928-F21]